jgi:hypothetical protein
LVGLAFEMAAPSQNKAAPSQYDVFKTFANLQAHTKCDRCKKNIKGCDCKRPKRHTAPPVRFGGVRKHKPTPKISIPAPLAESVGLQYTGLEGFDIDEGTGPIDFASIATDSGDILDAVAIVGIAEELKSAAQSIELSTEMLRFPADLAQLYLPTISDDEITAVLAAQSTELLEMLPFQDDLLPPSNDADAEIDAMVARLFA